MTLQISWMSILTGFIIIVLFLSFQVYQCFVEFNKIKPYIDKALSEGKIFSFELNDDLGTFNIFLINHFPEQYSHNPEIYTIHLHLWDIETYNDLLLRVNSLATLGHVENMCRNYIIEKIKINLLVPFLIANYSIHKGYYKELKKVFKLKDEQIDKINMLVELSI